MDFIVQKQAHTRMLVQVCASMAAPETRKREITALNEAMAELQQPLGIIVTRDEEERITVKAGRINVMRRLALFVTHCRTHMRL